MARPYNLKLMVFLFLIAFAFTIGACSTPPPAPTQVPVPATAPVSAPASPTAVVAPTTAPPTVATQAQPSGKLTAVRQDEPPTLDWKDMTNEPQTFVSWAIMEGLTNRDPNTGKVLPVLAESWKWDGNLTWTFNLRKGVKFHNGEPFNAASVVYTYQRIADKNENAQLAQHLQNMDSIKALDDYTVQITHKAPDPMFDARAQFLRIAPPKYSQENKDKLATTLVGTGPYKFVGWQKGQSFSMTVNEDYWGPKPKIKDVTVFFRAEPTVRAAMVRTGEADIAWSINPEDIPTVPKVLQYQDLRTIAMRVDASGQHPALKDVRVRQAMLYAIDTKTLSDTLLKNVATQPMGNQQVAPAATGYDPNMKPWPYDVSKAKQLIADAKAAGVPVDTPINIYERGIGWFPHDNELAEYAANAWKQIGLNVKVNVLDTAAWTTMLFAVKPEDKHGDLMYLLHSVELVDYSHSADRFLYSDARISTWKDPKTDGLLKAAAVLSGDARAKAFQEVAHYLEDKVPFIVFGNVLQTHAINPKLKWTPRPDGIPTFWEMSLD